LVQTTEKDVKDIVDQLNKLQDALEISNENGLFNNNFDIYEKILNYIIEAHKEIYNEQSNIIEANRKFSLAFFEFNKVINSTDFWWRFKYSFGGPIIIYFILILILISLTWINISSHFLEVRIFGVHCWAFIWGTIGSILQGFWWLWQHVSDRSLRKYWFVWFLLLPIIGAILGALMYFIFNAGFIAATGEVQLKSEIFPMLLSALAGFSCRWAIKSLNELTTLIQIRTRNET